MTTVPLSASGQVTFQFFSLKEWYGLWAQPRDLLWLTGWSRSDGVSLDTRPQRSYLFPPTFNTSAFTVSITPWRAHKPQEKKGRLEHRCRSIELHQNQNHPSHWDQLTLQSTWGCVNKLSWDPATGIHLNCTDAHCLYTAAILCLISYTVRTDYCKFINPCCRRRNWGSARLSDLQD